MSHPTRPLSTGLRPGRVSGSRRRVRIAALTVAAGLALTACAGGTGGGPNPGGDDEGESASPGETVQIKFSWWGSDTRHELTQEVIDAFMAENPDIRVVADYTDWNGYWDKLATTVAGGDAPDVITQEERYLRDYATRGVLTDMAQIEGLDLSQIDDSILEAGQMDGAQYGVPTGVNAYVIVADPQIFAEAGVEMPDDTTWTWEDYVRIASEISANHPDGAYGAQDYGFNEPGFAIFARQRGEELYNDDGSLGFSPETLAEWWQISLDLQDAGGTPPAAESIEIDAGGPEQSLVGTNRGAMAFFWTNQLGAITNASGRDLVVLRHPGESTHERTGMYFKAAMFYSVAESSDHPEAAAKLVDYLLNDAAAGEKILSDRGLPANTEVRAEVRDSFEEVDQYADEFLTDLEDEIIDGPAVPPVGAGEVASIVRRINEQVLFRQLTPMEAAEQFMSQVEAATGG